VLGLLLVALVMSVTPALADPWYAHYANAEKALENGDWTLAVQELNEALEKRGDSGARVRTYGMKVTPYFPYLKLGIAYYELGQVEAALQAFETEERLGAVGESEAAAAELERYRGLARDALEKAAAREERRIAQVVRESLGNARDLEGRGLLDEAMAALDRALAVAPDAVDVQEAVSRIRQKIGEQEREREEARRVARLVDDGRALLREGGYSGASSLFRQALSLRPSPEVQGLLDEAQRGLRAEIEPAAESRAAIAGGLEEVRSLESAGDPGAALERLQAVLALDPTHAEAQQILGRLLEAQEDEAAAAARRETIERLLQEAREQFEAGSAERSLSAANRVLALESGNADALRHVARAYGLISQRLLGTGPRQNLPPAVRFVDLREEGEDGTLVQTIRTPELRLSGVVIDSSPVEIHFFAGEERLDVEAALDRQVMGSSHITEFALHSRLPPGLSTFRLVATDDGGLSTSSEYAVLYARPFFRAPWFYAVLLIGAVGVCGAVVWRRSRRRGRLRRRRFNPYVAGAPVRQDGMFFGRRELVDRILDTIHNNSLLLHGERRIGKTSIQHQLSDRLKELDDPHFQFFPVYIDLQGTPEERFFATMAEDIFRELAPVLDGLSPGKDPGGEYDYRDFVRDLHGVLRALKKRSPKEVRLVLLIDEVDELNDYDPRINQKLRSLFMKSFAENLVSVVSGVEIKKQWGKEGSPWYNFFEELEVLPLATADARRLVEEPIRGMFTLETGAADRIVELTDGKPYLIQKCCIALVTRLHEARRRKITIADVDAVGRPEED
jgi:tetratricopeptide (TPR) repeat protein